MIYTFFSTDTATTEIYTLSLHDALPISMPGDKPPVKIAEGGFNPFGEQPTVPAGGRERSEEHTSELQSHSDLVCRLLLEKKKENGFCVARLARIPIFSKGSRADDIINEN